MSAVFGLWERAGNARPYGVDLGFVQALAQGGEVSKGSLTLWPSAEGSGGPIGRVPQRLFASFLRAQKGGAAEKGRYVVCNITVAAYLVETCLQPLRPVEGARRAGSARPYDAESGFVGGGAFDAPRVSYNSLERDVVAPSPTVWV